MTREEALRELTGAISKARSNEKYLIDSLTIDAVAAAIEALKVEVCQDSVSRKKVLEIIRNIDIREDVFDAVIKVKELPPTTPPES